MSRIALRVRIAIVITALQTALIAAVLWLMLSMARASIDQQMRLKAQVLVATIGEVSRIALIREEFDDLQPYVVTLTTDPDVRAVRLADRRRRVVVSTDPGEVGLPLPATPPGAAARLWVERDIANASGTLGTLSFQLSDLASRREYLRTRDVALILAALGVLASAGVGLLLGGVLTRRLEALASATQRIAGGDFDVALEAPGTDEVARLGGLFNQMAANLKAHTERLAVEKERLAVTLQSIGDAVIATDAQARVTILNAVAEQLTGWRAAEALGQPLEAVFRVVHEDTGLSAENPVARVLREGAVVGLANHAALRARDGRVRSIADSGAPIRSADGTISGVVLVFRDQTEERRAERARREGEARLARSEQRYRLLADHSQDVIWTLDLATQRFSYVSPSILKLRGYTPEEVVAQPLDRALMPESLARARALLAKVGTPDEPESFTAVFDQPCLDGTVKHVETSAALVRGPAGVPTGLLGVSRDATARVKAEEALRKSEERFRVLIEKSTDMILVFDAEKRIQFWSPSATDCLGWSAREVIGKRPVDLRLVHADDWPVLAEAVRGVEGGERRLARAVLRLRHKDGSWRLVEGTGRNLLDDPAVRGLVANVRDVTDQRRLEEQYRQAQKLESVGRLAGGIAHDFNNILTVILSCASALEEDLSQQRPADRGDVEQILASGIRARDLTRQLLAFARRQVIAPVPLDLNEVITAGQKLLQRVLGEDVTLVVDLDPSLGPILGDPGQVEQVLMNLAVNARDAMPQGGTLTLETRNAGPEAVRGEAQPQVLFRVRDTGVGISAEAKAHLFEPFYTTKPLGKGTGLGLATVYGIVSQSGGSIQVDSEPGKGTTFEIRFPRSRSAAAPPPREEKVQGGVQRGTETVLVVEDDPQVRAVTVRVLSGAGYRVLVAADGAEAIEIAGRLASPADIVVTDVVMPGLGGRAVVDELRRRHPALRALYLSGYAEDAIAQRGVLDEGIHFLAKPFTPSSLLATVREILDAP